MSQLDYDKLLDDWAEEILARADDFGEKADQVNTGSFKQGYCTGMQYAYINAVTILNSLKTKKVESTVDKINNLSKGNK